MRFLRERKFLRQRARRFEEVETLARFVRHLRHAAPGNRSDRLANRRKLTKELLKKLGDNGAVMGVLPLDKLPATREAYDTDLRAKGFTQYEAGYLPYSIIGGWQQVRKDFAYWRALTKPIETAATPEERAWFEADRRLREKLTIHDIGIWIHYVADASQPLHVSVHFNGWGDFPNTSGYTNSKKIHAYFEGEFVRVNLSRAAVAAKIKPQQCCPTIEDHTRELLLASFEEVNWLYQLEKAGGIAKGDPRGIAFATDRLAAGATTLRDMIANAWREAYVTGVGYPMVKVVDIEGGKVRATRELFGAD